MVVTRFSGSTGVPLSFFPAGPDPPWGEFLNPETSSRDDRETDSRETMHPHSAQVRMRGLSGMILSRTVTPDSKGTLLSGDGLAHFEVCLQGDNLRIEVNKMKGRYRI
jgi:hypothetical protein